MKSRPQATQIWVLVLLLATLVLGALSQRNTQEAEKPWPRAQLSDSTPLGAKGLRLLGEWLGYPVRRVDQPLQKMPGDARIWFLLDYKTQFSRAESRLLLDWVKNGGTLFFAMPPAWAANNDFNQSMRNSGLELAKQLGIEHGTALNWTWEPLPPLSPLRAGAPGNYWSDVKGASASAGTISIKKGTALEIAGTLQGAQVARLDLERGRIFVAADALLFTNYALDAQNTADFVTNLLRAHVQPTPQNAIYFDERRHGENVAAADAKRSWAYYVWQPPLRYAVLQVLFAGLLTWMLFGRRLGSPVPLPADDPVTRASQFAQAMGTLLQKGKRPRVVAEILGDEFRRNLAKKLGLSPHDSDEVLAARAAQVANLPAEHVARLLRVSKMTTEDEDALLNEVQQMENVIRRLSR